MQGIAAWQKSTFQNVVVTNVTPVMKDGKVIALRGFLKVYGESGQYQFGRPFWIYVTADQDPTEALKGRLTVKPDGTRSAKPEARLAWVSGYFHDRNKGSVWYQNFVVTDFATPEVEAVAEVEGALF